MRDSKANNIREGIYSIIVPLILLSVTVLQVYDNNLYPAVSLALLTGYSFNKFIKYTGKQAREWIRDELA